MKTEAGTTEQQIRDILTFECGLDDVNNSAHLTDDLGLDSLDLVELYMAVEEKFDMVIPDDDFDQMETLQQIVAYVDRKKAH